jgi:hypothetical protein
VHAQHNEISVTLARNADDLFVRPADRDEFFSLAPRACFVWHEGL